MGCRNLDLVFKCYLGIISPDTKDCVIDIFAAFYA